MRPLIKISQERVARGEEPLFQSHMWDGSAVPLAENLEIAQELLAKAAAAHVILEIEVGVVGGEEDGVANEINEKLYTTDQDFLDTLAALGDGSNGRYLLAATFGNVHGVYKPGNVKLRPDVLKNGQDVWDHRWPAEIRKPQAEVKRIWHRRNRYCYFNRANMQREQESSDDQSAEKWPRLAG